MSIQVGTRGLNAMAASPDGQVIATVGDDPAVRLWSTSGLQPVGEFAGHTGRVWSMAYLPHTLSAWNEAPGTVEALVDIAFG